MHTQPSVPLCSLFDPIRPARAPGVQVPEASPGVGSLLLGTGEGSQKQLVSTEAHGDSQTADVDRLPAGLSRRLGPQPRIAHD